MSPLTFMKVMSRLYHFGLRILIRPNVLKKNDCKLKAAISRRMLVFYMQVKESCIEQHSVIWAPKVVRSRHGLTIDTHAWRYFAVTTAPHSPSPHPSLFALLSGNELMESGPENKCPNPHPAIRNPSVSCFRLAMFTSLKVNREWELKIENQWEFHSAALKPLGLGSYPAGRKTREKIMVKTMGLSLIASRHQHFEVWFLHPSDQKATNTIDERMLQQLLFPSQATCRGFPRFCAWLILLLSPSCVLLPSNFGITGKTSNEIQNWNAYCLLVQISLIPFPCMVPMLSSTLIKYCPPPKKRCSSAVILHH